MIRHPQHRLAFVKQSLVHHGSPHLHTRTTRSSPAPHHSIGRFAPGLRHLSMFNIHSVTDSVVLSLTNCRDLQFLSVSRCMRVTDKSVSAVVSSCARLQTLKVNGCVNLTDQALLGLRSGLRALDVGGCPKMKKEVISVLAGRCRKLKHLNLHGMKLDDQSVQDLTDGCRSLQHLQLGSTNHFGGTGSGSLTDASLLALARCTELTRLDVQGHAQLSSPGLASLLGVAHSKLQHLNVGGCRKLDDSAFVSLGASGSARTLTSLSTFGLPQLTDTALEHIAELPSLTNLDLHSCAGVAGAPLRDAAAGALPMLQVLDLSLCPRAREAAASLRESRPGLRVVHF